MTICLIYKYYWRGRKEREGAAIGTSLTRPEVNLLKRIGKSA